MLGRFPPKGDLTPIDPKDSGVSSGRSLSGLDDGSRQEPQLLEAHSHILGQFE